MNTNAVPLVSVIMGVYNGERYLRKALQSILKQTLIDYEFIIVDDGSTDDSYNIIKSFKDVRITLLRQNNSGCYNALNLGISHSKSKYIAILDSDDFSHEERLKKQYDYLENNKECVCCATETIIVDEDGNHICTIQNNLSMKELRKQLPDKNPFTHSSLMFRTKNMLDIGGYKNIRHSADVLALIDLQKYGEIHILKEPLCYYRLRRGSMTFNMPPKLNHKLLELRRDYFINGTLNFANYLEIERIRKSYRLNEKTVNFNYFMTVGKYYLDQNKKSNAKKHFITSLKYKPINIVGYFYLLLSFAPNLFYLQLKYLKSIVKKLFFENKYGVI